MDHICSWEQFKYTAPYKMFYLIIHIKDPIGTIRIAVTFCINARFYLQFEKDTRVSQK